jgi:hypothetical protein
MVDPETVGAEVTSTAGISVIAKALSTCTAGTVDPDIISTTGGTSFRYADGQFIYNWATPKPANICYRAYVLTPDGSTAMFSSTDLETGVAREAYFKSK